MSTWSGMLKAAGQPHGRGAMEDDGSLVGEFSYGFPQGLGTVIFPDGERERQNVDGTQSAH